MSNYGALLKDEWLLLPVVYTAIRTIGNPLDMVASGKRRDRDGKRRLSVVRLTSNLFLHVPQDVLSFV
jgi:hypothetical protein